MTEDDDLDAKLERAKIAYEQAEAMFRSDLKRRDYWAEQTERSNRRAHTAYEKYIQLRDQKFLKGLSQ